MPSAPLVTAVVPTYRRPDYLRVAIESALVQTFTDLEVVVSDNAADVEVERLVRSYRDERLVYRHNDGNIGPLRNALAAFGAARGDYVAMLHDDDAWEPRFLERLVPPLEADPSLALAFSDHWIMGTDGSVDLDETQRNTRVWRREGLAPGAHRPFHRLALVDRAVPIAMAAVMRKSAIDWSDIPEDVGSIYDIWLAYLASRDGGGAWYEPERLTRYRHHGGAITSSSRYDRLFVFCYDRFLADERLRPVRHELEREAANFRTGLGLALLREGDTRAARPHLWRGVRTGGGARAAAGLAASMLPVGAPRLVAAGAGARRRLGTGTGTDRA